MAPVNRRTMIGFAAAGLASTLSVAEPQFPAAQSPAIAAPASEFATEFVFEAIVTLHPAVEIGATPQGIRRYIPITGGTFQGPKIKGIVLSGGADWQTQRPDGVTEVDALYSIQTDDRVTILVRNQGLLAGSYFKTLPRFEAPIGPYDWLNKSIFLSSVAGAQQPGAVTVRVSRVR